jgi:predicted nuclease of predicted toxin-antitoxin system
MNFLLNENIPPRLIGLLKEVGWNCTHINDVALNGRPDFEIVEFATRNNLTIITHDLDYGRIVSLSGKSTPSVVTFRLEKISADSLYKLIKTHRQQLEKYVQRGALLTVDERKIRYRLLPVEK